MDKKILMYTKKSRLQKALNSLAGIVQGISADQSINSKELAFLHAWLDDHSEALNKHPYNELGSVLTAAIKDHVISDEEKDDILWLCKRINTDSYFDSVTSDLQVLQGILGGIASDRVICTQELLALSDWISDHEHLKSMWPFDEVESLIMQVLKDKKIDEDEQQLVMEFFSEFTPILDDRTITSPLFKIESSIQGICAIAPEIIFEDASFCFTGESSIMTRAHMEQAVLNRGGVVSKSITKKVDYLVIGSAGNPCWAYSCYGRKVEQAIELRKQGRPLVIAHEVDFHDALN